MKIAIHSNPDFYGDRVINFLKRRKIYYNEEKDVSFSARWIDYCKQTGILYKIVNCFDSNIVAQLEDCDALMWHFFQHNYKDTLLAKQLLFSLEQAGKKTFPCFNTCWHFDDKLGQKYLLESIGAPLVPTHIFYEKEDALAWAKNAAYPKVFKLRGGAGSENVKLVKDKKEALTLIRKAFGRGFPQFNRWTNFKEKIRKIRIGKENAFIGLAKGSYRLFASSTYAKMKGNEKGYVYFQEFMPNNNSDTRIIIIGDKAFAIKRMVRSNDFRASGSGIMKYEKDEIDTRCVNIAFAISEKLQFQCMTYDFVLNENNEPLIIEISYGFLPQVYTDCPGYWDKSLNFHEGAFNPYGWMVEQVLRK